MSHTLAPVKAIRSIVTPISPGSIPSSSSFETTVSVPGAAINDVVMVNPVGVLGGHFVVGGYVSAANTVTIRYTNYTTNSEDPGTVSFRVTVMSF